jgi:hypothetical protein
MIAFRENDNSDEIQVIKNLQKLLNKLDNLESSMLLEFCPEEYDNINISDITQIIYEKLFQDNSTVISLLITKSDNNSLNLVIDMME